MQSKEVTISGGDSVTVDFSITTDSVGRHELSIGGLTGTFEVEAATPAVTSGNKPEITSFSVTPSYDSETGKLISASIVYRMKELWSSTPDAQMMLKVFLDGELMEAIPLLSLSQQQTDGETGSLGYIPSEGWRTGIYSFQAELYEDESSIQNTEQQQFTVTPESITQAVSWKTLGMIICATLIVIAAMIVLIVYRRRDMLRGYIDD